MQPQATAPALLRQRLPWLGGDLQTLRNALLPAPPPLAGERILLQTHDDSGDRLWALLNRPSGQASGLLAVLVHGLSGHEASPYMTVAARRLLQDGHAVARLNMRGAGPSRADCRQHYHAGRSADLADALADLCDIGGWDGGVLIGFSLGGNIALKCAAEAAADDPLRAVATVSAPIDLAHTSRHMLRRRNWVYHQALLQPFKREVLSMQGLTEAERFAVRRSRNFLEFDDCFVAPRNGFAGAWDYYGRSMALQYLDDIAVPGLLIQAQDDPIVPARAYLARDWRRNPLLLPRLPRHGGHVGFHGPEPEPWYLSEIAGFLQRISRRTVRQANSSTY